MKRESLQSDLAPAGARASTGHRSALDGLRALAIVGVMFVHAGAPGFRSGWIGVDLFFALSGFLITTLLAMESSTTGTVAYVPFMARRLLRLMPAYFLYAAFVTAMIWVWPGSVASSTGGWTVTGLTAALWGYFINFVPQGGIWNGQDLTVHLWSLSVEQQYYLVWPLVILAMHRWPTRLLGIAAMLTAGAMLGFVLAPVGLYKDTMLFTRGFSLVLASTLALWAYRHPALLSSASLNLALTTAGTLLLLGLFALPYAGWAESRTRNVFIPLLVPIFAFWIARLWHVPVNGLLRRFLCWAPMVYIGRVSYGIYLYHEAVRVATWQLMKPEMADWPSAFGFAARLAVYMLISFVLAALSYELFEKKFLTLSSRFRPSRTAATGASQG